MRCPNRAQYGPGPLQLLYMHAALLQARFAFFVKTAWLLENVMLVVYVIPIVICLQLTDVCQHHTEQDYKCNDLAEFQPDESSNHSTMMSQLAALGGHVHGCLERHRKHVLYFLSLSCVSSVDLFMTSGVLPVSMSDLHSCLGQPSPLLPPLSSA